MPSARPRYLFVLASLLALLALSASVYLEKVVLLRPCSLCLVQRGCIALVALICAMASVFRSKTPSLRTYASFALLFSALGAASAIRQLWLQVSAPLSPHLCYPNLFLSGQSQPPLETLRLYVLGSPDCAVINWTMLDMSLPEWSLLAFAGLIAISVFQLFKR